MNSFVRVPPDSTGKKMATVQHVVGDNTVEVSTMHVVDYSDPTKGQKVNTRGAASVTFAGGSPSLDRMGSLRVAEQTAVAVYEYSTKDYASLFTDNLANGGTITFDKAGAKATMSVGSGTGASSVRTSNRYHYYQPGVPMLNLLPRI